MIAVDVVAAAAVEVVAEAVASVKRVVGYFGPATQEAKSADSPTPVMKLSALARQHGVAVKAAVVDRLAVAGSGSCHKASAEKHRRRLANDCINTVLYSVPTTDSYAHIFTS